MKKFIILFVLLGLVACKPSPEPSKYAELEKDSERIEVLNKEGCVYIVKIDDHLYGSTCGGGLTHLESCDAFSHK